MEHLYDVIYRTKSGRVMIAKRVSAKTGKDAMLKIKKNMKASSTFDKCVSAFRID